MDLAQIVSHARLRASCVCDNQIVMRRHIKCSQLKKMRLKQKVHIWKASLAFKLSVWDCHFVGSITMSWFWERALKCETFPIHTSCNQHHYLWMFSASINTFLMKLAPSHQRVYQVSIRLSLQVVLTYHLLFGLNLFHIQLMLYQWRLSSFFYISNLPKIKFRTTRSHTVCSWVLVAPPAPQDCVCDVKSAQRAMMGHDRAGTTLLKTAWQKLFESQLLAMSWAWFDCLGEIRTQHSRSWKPDCGYFSLALILSLTRDTSDKVS